MSTRDPEQADDIVARFSEGAPLTERHPDPALGPVYVQRGMYGEALFSANLMLASDDRLPIAWRLRGEALFGLERFGDAESAFAKVSELDPAGPPSKGVLEWRALCAARQGDIARAQEMIVAHMHSRDLPPDELLRLQHILVQLHEQVPLG